LLIHRFDAKSKEVKIITEGKEVAKTLYTLFEEIAKREKKKAIETDDYGTAFVAAILEGLFKEALLTIQS